MLNSTSNENKKRRTEMAVQVKEKNPYERIRSLDNEIRGCLALRNGDLKLFDRVTKENVNLSNRIKALEEQKKKFAEAATFIDFIACVREFVLHFEQLNFVKLPVDFVSAVRIILPSFPDSPITQGEHCRKLLWILLEGDELCSEHLKLLRNYLNRDVREYLTFSGHMQELFGLFSIAPRTNTSLTFGCMSRQEVEKYTQSLLPHLQTSLRLFHEAYEKALTVDQ